MGEQLEGNRRNEERDLELGLEDRRLRRDARDVDEDARPQFPALICLGISPQGALVPGAAGEVAVGARLELLEREGLEIRDVDRLGDAARLFRVRRK
jgi:hypothetical protein